jgi:putative SOS response-associated peptidase YedK
MLNARSERILEDTKSYWYKIRNRRCLIPLNGFYEHRAVKGFKNKIPYFITLKSQAMFFLPGLYSVSEIVDKETGELVKVWSYTLITRNANSVMKQIHNDGDNKWRMPLMLPFELSKQWVEEELSVEQYKAILNFEMPSQELNYIPVYTIRSPKLRPDDKAKNEFYEWENLPELEIEL